MIKLKQILNETFDGDHEAWRKSWLERHNATFDERGRLIAYHGTTPVKANLIKQSGFRSGSNFTLRPEYAKHWGRKVLEVHLPLDAITFITSDIVSERPIKWEEVV